MIEILFLALTKVRNMKVPLKSIVWKEGDFYVSKCLNVEVSSFGNDKEDAIKNLKEALELYFEDMPIEETLRIEDVEIV
jgi:predicted RNase H-like HicB family nuclease